MIDFIYWLLPLICSANNSLICSSHGLVVLRAYIRFLTHSIPCCLCQLCVSITIRCHFGNAPSHWLMTLPLKLLGCSHTQNDPSTISIGEGNLCATVPDMIYSCLDVGTQYMYIVFTFADNFFRKVVLIFWWLLYFASDFTDTCSLGSNEQLASIGADRWLSGKLWYLQQDQHNCVGDTRVYQEDS